MTDLKRFNSQEALSMIDTLRSEFDYRLIPAGQFRVALDQCKFRDDNGYYWTVGHRTRNWYWFGEGRWQSSAAVPYGFEAPAALTIWSRALPPMQAFSPPQAAQPGLSNHQLLETIVINTRAAYWQGLITSQSAEAMLAEFFLVDMNGRMWTPGFRSGSWYYFQASGWQHAGKPPEDRSLIKRDSQAAHCTKCGRPLNRDSKFCPGCGTRVEAGPAITPQIEAIIMESITRGLGTLPEPVAEEWFPPAGPPEWDNQAMAPTPPPPQPQPMAPPPTAISPIPVNQPRPPFTQTPPIPPSPPIPPIDQERVDAPRIINAPTSPDVPRQCTRCGRAVRPGKKFCTNCGTPVQ